MTNEAKPSSGTAIPLHHTLILLNHLFYKLSQFGGLFNQHKFPISPSAWCLARPTNPKHQNLMTLETQNVII